MLLHDKTQSVSEYEKWRAEKIKRNKALLDSLFPDLKESKQKLKSALSVKRKERRKRVSAPYIPSPGPLVIRRNPGREARRSATYCPEGAIIQMSSESCALGDDDVWESGCKIRFGRGSRYRRMFSPEKTEIVLESDEEDEEEKKERIERMMKPAYHVVDKKYDKLRGTTCHQCRQKTLDGKTRCNNKRCVGVRGQFCGVCLLNRYGEDAETVIRDKKWICPPCGGYCNCSICLPKRGKQPTGILTPFIKAKGFNNVKEYLASFEEEEPEPDTIIEIMETAEETTDDAPPDDENKENIDPNQNNPNSHHKLQMTPLEVRISKLPMTADTELPHTTISPTSNKENQIEESKEEKKKISSPDIADPPGKGERVDLENSEVAMIRLSTEKMNISCADDGPTPMIFSPAANRKSTSRFERTISRCLIMWKTSRYAGGYQWLAPDKVVNLDRKRPQIGSTVKVKWGKKRQPFPALLSKVEYKGGRKKHHKCRMC